MTKYSPADAPRNGLTWARVEDGFYVASNEGGLVGFIDRVEEESFQVCNALSQQIGFFHNLESAMRCLTHLSAAASRCIASDDSCGMEDVSDES